MNLQKQKPFRSKSFMAFLHNRRDLVGESCAVCQEAQWTQLHHFGMDGGRGMKPSDLYLVRLCKTCADRYEIKMRALIIAGRWELLSIFTRDALHNVETWIKYKERAKQR